MRTIFERRGSSTIRHSSCGERSPWSEQIAGDFYGEDPAGNRTLLRHGETDADNLTYYEYNEANELTRLHDSSGWTYFQYDSNGNTIEEQTPTYTRYYDWDGRDMMTGVRSTEDGWTDNEIEYDKLASRKSLVDSTGTTYYTWDGINVLKTEDEQGSLKQRQVHGYAPMTSVGDIALMEISDAVYIPVSDQPGTIWNLLDSAAGKANSYAYDAFGVARTTSETISNPYRFGTKPLDADTLLYHCLMRQYIPGKGRFLSQDVRRARTFENPYGYVNAGPLTGVDPYGLDRVIVAPERWQICVKKCPGGKERIVWNSMRNARVLYQLETGRVKEKRFRPIDFGGLIAVDYTMAYTGKTQKGLMVKWSRDEPAVPLEWLISLAIDNPGLNKPLYLGAMARDLINKLCPPGYPPTAFHLTQGVWAQTKDVVQPRVPTSGQVMAKWQQKWKKDWAIELVKAAVQSYASAPLGALKYSALLDLVTESIKFVGAGITGEMQRKGITQMSWAELEKCIEAQHEMRRNWGPKQDPKHRDVVCYEYTGQFVLVDTHESLAPLFWQAVSSMLPLPGED